jgi:hypothetical protein
MTNLIHPRLLEKLEKDFFPQRCALKEPAKTQDSAGQEITTHSVHVGYESIPCRVGAAGGGQRRGNQQIYLEATHRIVLSGDYQELPDGWLEGEEWIAEVDGVEYKILMVGRSAEKTTTRLETRIVA